MTGPNSTNFRLTRQAFGKFTFPSTKTEIWCQLTESLVCTFELAADRSNRFPLWAMIESQSFGRTVCVKANEINPLMLSEVASAARFTRPLSLNLEPCDRRQLGLRDRGIPDGR